MGGRGRRGMPVCRSRSRRSRQAANCTVDHAARAPCAAPPPLRPSRPVGRRMWDARRGSSRASCCVPVRCVRSWQAPPRRYPHARERPPSRSATQR
eukprot:scaffold2033_cov72-Phaeocystis_antarctica.AAC.2